MSDQIFIQRTKENQKKWNFRSDISSNSSPPLIFLSLFLRILFCLNFIFPCSTSSDITPSPVYIHTVHKPHIPPLQKSYPLIQSDPTPFFFFLFRKTTTVPPSGEIFIEVSLFSSLLTTVKKIQPHPHPVSYVSPHLPQLQKKCPLQFTVHDFPFHVQASYLYYFEHDAT